MADRELDNHDKVCKICGIAKKRIRAGVFKKKVGKSPRWVGEDGLLWNGAVCPTCHRNQTAVRMSLKRSFGE